MATIHRLHPDDDGPDVSVTMPAKAWQELCHELSEHGHHLQLRWECKLRADWVFGMYTRIREQLPADDARRAA